MRLPGSHMTGILCITICGVGAAYAFALPLFCGFAFGFVALIAAVMSRGADRKQLVRSIAHGAGHTKEVVYILLLVGMLIPAWMASGMIPFLIDTGLSLMNPAYFTAGSFVLAAVISMTLGTSTGTLSSVGLPIMGMAPLLHVPLPLVAGALVSGAFVGDRSSPFSSAHLLIAASTGVTVKRLSRALATTGIAAFVLSVCFFLAFDLWGNWAASGEGIVKTGFSDVFHYHPVLFIPPLLLILPMLFRLPGRIGFLLSIAAALIIGSWLQHISAGQWVEWLWSGYHSSLLPTLQSKGVSNMIDLVLLILLAGAFNGIIEEFRLLEPYLGRLFGDSFTLVGGTWRTLAFASALCLVSCTQTLPIMMSGRNLLPIWTKRLPQEQLSRVVADTSAVIAGLVPWNLIAILCSTILAVPVEQFVPFSIFLWSLPLLTLAVSARGFKFRREQKFSSEKFTP
jgi:Na+:H+ antiporter, NhaC family